MKSNHWSSGWDNVNWSLYARIYKVRIDNDSIKLNIHTNKLADFFRIRFNTNKNK